MCRSFRRKRQRNAKIWWLKLLGWTDREVMDHVEVSKGTVSNVWSEFPDLEKVTNDLHARGRTVREVPGRWAKVHTVKKGFPTGTKENAVTDTALPPAFGACGVLAECCIPPRMR